MRWLSVCAESARTTPPARSATRSSNRDIRCCFVPPISWSRSCSPPSGDLGLPQKLRRLDSFELLILDDIGYVKQRAEEAEVLFTLIAERYERRSMLITSNLVFSDWERIFRDPIATAAAIDRLVHHAMILEFNVPSYRTRKRRPTDAGETVAGADPIQRNGGRMAF